MRLNSIGTIFAAALLMAACGKGANATKQDIITLDPPSFPKNAEGVFALQGDKKSTGYKSTMLILNPTGNPALLADVIRVSEQTRIKAAESRAYMLNEAKFMPGGSAENELSDKKNELNKFLNDARRDPETIAIAKENAKAWLATKLPSLGLSAEVNSAFQARWNAYCDAKIVELAVHPEFAARSVDGYSQRPSPQQFCESYYEERGYFKGESCTKGDYFSCLWLEGVMKSGSATNKAALAAMLDPIFGNAEKIASFRSLLISTKDVAGSLIQKQEKTGFSDTVYKRFVGEIFEMRRYFSTTLLADKPPLGTGTDTNCKKLLVDPTFEFVCGAFSKTWNAKPAQTYLNAIETDKSLVTSNPSLKTIFDAAKYFGTRPLDTALRVSNSDFYFHNFVGPLPVEPSSKKLGMSTEDLDLVSAEVVGKIFPGLSEKNLETKAKMEQSISALEDEIKQKRQKNDDLTFAANQAIQQGIRAATEGDVAFGFLAYFMTVNHYDRIMRATITFDGFPTQFFEGCYDKDQRRPIDCPAGIGEPGKNDVMYKATLNLFPEKGRIDFSFVVDNPDAVGLGYKPKVEGTPEYFMSIKSEELKGMNLRFELYPNRLENSLDILTGKTLFARDGRDVYEAGLSMWEL